MSLLDERKIGEFSFIFLVVVDRIFFFQTLALKERRANELDLWWPSVARTY